MNRFLFQTFRFLLRLIPCNQPCPDCVHISRLIQVIQRQRDDTDQEYDTGQ